MATAFAVMAFLVCLHRTATEVSTQQSSADSNSTMTVSSLTPTSAIISSSLSMTDENMTLSTSNPLSSSPSYSSLTTSIHVSPSATAPVAQLNNNSTGSQSSTSASLIPSSVPRLDSVLVTTDGVSVMDEITETTDIYIMTPTLSVDETTGKAPPPSGASTILSTPMQSQAASKSFSADISSASRTPPLLTVDSFHSLETKSTPSSVISPHLQQPTLSAVSQTPLADSNNLVSASMTSTIENLSIGGLKPIMSSASTHATAALNLPVFPEMSTAAYSGILSTPYTSSSLTEHNVTPILSPVNISIHNSQTHAYDYVAFISSSPSLALSPTPFSSGTWQFLGTSVEFTPLQSGTFATLDATYHRTQILSTVPILSSSVPDNITESTPQVTLISSMVYEPGFTALVTDPQRTSQPETSSHKPVDGRSTASVDVHLAISGTMVLSGNCSVIIANKSDFIRRFKTSLSSHSNLNLSRITVTEVSCDPMEVNFTLLDTSEADLSEARDRLMESQVFSLNINGEVFTTVSVMFHSNPYAGNPTRPPSSRTPPITDGDGKGIRFKHQQRLIYIVVGVVVGFVVLLALIVVVHHAMRKMCKKSTRSFDIREEPCIKLTDFNMAHTCIPRPRSIYSSIGADGKFCRYDDKERGGHPPASPTSSFMYANSDEIKEHYHEVIDPAGHGLVTPNTPDNSDFGRSGLPDWNLPLIDGAVPANSNVSPDLISSVDSHRSSPPSSSSGTFRPPSTSISTLNSRPVFSPPAPPPPPPPPLPTPTLFSGTLQSRTSCDASSEMTDSSGDTNTLTKGSSDVGASMMGIDNPLMTPEEDYDYIEPSTSSRMKRYMIH